MLRGETLAPQPALAELLNNNQTLRALRTNALKVIRPNDDAPALLFRLDRDPGEKHGVSPGGPDDAALREATAMLVREIERTRAFRDLLDEGDAQTIQLSDEMRERLRSLGYLEAD